RAAMKPLPTLGHPLPTVDLARKEPVPAATERTDAVAVPAAAVVAEAAVALVLADALCEKLGGDSLAEMRRNFDALGAALREV
ncbi:MAG TPA: chorismate synthase, partial [Polyangia bacterium]